MIRLLSIRQLAVVEQLEIEFDSGLNVLTGETGAGKSILVDAVALLLGERASPEMIRAGAPSAVVQAEVDIGDRTLIVRRELSAQGRSRAFVDDNLVTTGSLRETLSTVIELHGQHEHQRLLSASAQLDLLDAYAGCSAEREQTRRAFGDWQKADASLDECRRQEHDRETTLGNARIELADIDRVSPRPGEDAQLETERLVLVNADKLHRLSHEAYAALYEDDRAVVPQLRGVFRRIAELSSIDERFAELEASRPGLEAQLDEMARFLRAYAATLDAQGDRLQAVEDRLAALAGLKRRFGPQLEDVLERRSRLAETLAGLEDAADRITRLQRARDEAHREYVREATALSRKRKKGAPALCRALEAELAHLAMAGARCEWSWAEGADREDQWSARGFDTGELLLAANRGEPLRPLARVASGGELSRIMLACHIIGGGALEAETLIFDEVDAGIGGHAADAVGERLRLLGTRRQVLCVTHLPQIAAHGDVQFRVRKQERGGRTVSTVERLADDGRTDELARMMVGRAPDSAAMAAARSLLDARRRTPGRKRK